MSRLIPKLSAYFAAICRHYAFPWLLALAAVVLMLPALGTGLMMDDLVQRVVQFKPAELPARVLDTGFVSEDSGQLSTVLTSLFGFPRGEERLERARNYGILAWWMPDNLRAALFRPFTSLTHWFDYRVLPNSPALMHAHNILWFAAAVFLAALLYREIGRRSWDAAASTADASMGCAAAALAACLFLLDKNTCFPVSFVANRGFIISLVFGLLCLQAHYRWRTSGAKGQMWASVGFLALSLLANEGGASTLAFLIAYALVLESGEWRVRLLSLAPAAAVMVAWRAVYVASGSGVGKLGGYIDPGYEPWLFLARLPVRMNALLGGQLSGLPPEITIALSDQLRLVVVAFFFVFSVVCVVVFLPVLRKDAVARFWGAAMVLALVPAATVEPLSKNMAFVAVGAFGTIASFLIHVTCRSGTMQADRAFRLLSWGVAAVLLFAHVPGALAGRLIMALAAPVVPKVVARSCSFEHIPEFGDHRVVCVNNPMILTTLASPFYRAYHGLPLPASLDSLVPGSTSFSVERVDARTFIINSREKDLFDCDAVGPLHIAYLSRSITRFMAGGGSWHPGDRVRRPRFQVEILKLSQRGAPSAAAFRFEQEFKPAEAVWIYFDWQRGSFLPFALPQVGETIEIPGPKPLKWFTHCP